MKLIFFLATGALFWIQYILSNADSIDVIVVTK